MYLYLYLCLYLYIYLYLYLYYIYIYLYIYWLVMLGTNIPKSICSKLQIWVSQYFLVRLRTLVPKYGMIYPITTFIPQIVGCIYPYF